MRKKAFKVSGISRLSDFKIGDFFSESDLALQNGNDIVQFKFIPKGGRSKKTIKPGIFQFSEDSSGIKLSPLDLSKKRIMMDLVNTKEIIKEAEAFFSKLHVYAELEIQPKRGLLLYSAPGFGKTATISVFAQQSIEKDPGTVVLVWPTSKISADSIQEFLSSDSKYSASATRVILIIEDIGGENKEGDGPRAVDSGILNMLDGVGETFKLPTFIIATTNTPEQLLASLSDRPGRFDRMLKLEPPSASDRLKLFEFVAKRPSTSEEANALTSTSANELSVAHITEIVIRHRLTDMPVVEVIKEIIDHSKKVANNFQNYSKMGFED